MTLPAKSVVSRRLVAIALTLCTLGAPARLLAQEAIHLTPENASGGQILTLKDGRKAIQHPAKTANQQSYTWKFATELKPGWHAVSVSFVPFKEQANGNTRQHFVFQSPGRATVNFQSLGGGASVDVYKFHFYTCGPVSGLEVHPAFALTDPTRGVISVDIAPEATPPKDGMLQLLDLEVSQDQKVNLPAGVGTGNWQIMARPADPAQNWLKGSMEILAGESKLASAPAGRDQYFYIEQAPSRVKFDCSPAIASARMISFPALGAVDSSQSSAVMPATDNSRVVTETFSLVGSPAAGAMPSLPLLPGGAKVAVVTSWDDGPSSDKRMATLLKKYGFGGTFFLTQKCWAREHDEKLLEQMGFEIGSHSLTHPAAWQISPERWRHETVQMRRELEADLGHAVISFAYPYNYNAAYDANGEYVLRELRAAGYWGGRTTRGASEEINGYKEPLTLGTDGHFQQPLAKLDEGWNKAASKNGGVFYFWGHTWENRSEQDWQNFEKTLEHFAHRPETWYANQGQIFIWKWLTQNVKFGASAGNAGEITLTRPWMDPYLAAACPLTIKLPEGATGVRWKGREIAAVKGYVTLPAE